MNLKGKCALITGSSRGIGKSIAVCLAEYGAEIAVNYVADDKNENLRDAEHVAALISEKGGRASIFEADVGDFNSVNRMVKNVANELRPIDILVNNAAILRDKTLKKMTPEEWDSVLLINLTGVFNCCRAVIETMTDSGWGRIINIASISGQIGFFGQTNYSAAKAGVIGFTKSCAREVAKKNITVNAIAPGVVETEMAKLIPQEVRDDFMKQIPMGRFALPEEIAETVAFLISDGAAYITGQTLHVNGGWYM